MGRYIDGFVLPVPKNKLKAYRKMASEAGKVWMKHGALEYIEAVGNDLKPNTHGMKIAFFPKMAKAKKGETVFFSFIVYKSRKHRDAVNKKVMKEMSKEMEKHKNMPMPFDMKRMAYGGFKAIVDFKKK
jgi:uncharacterized protein YbaA (DUF1428 family)